ncbi:hypothetical protein BTN33_21700 [Aeromonas veronii]|uniref:conjugal transfer mating-pair stabilization protein TraG n=1 Tax=Aeromonas veronii TaxID=654 RepID=UPI000946F129|nr:conjugal transfer mating-pair stabilization protein TraG [Aeromonas veronii]OLF56980.1 hypothetical protein BTN33_21700 [Aeromonas veronii]
MLSTIYVTTGGGMFRDTLNAVAAFISSDNWHTLMTMATTLSVGIATLAYIRTRDLTTMIKWVGVFVLVGSVLLGVKRPVQIIDYADPTAVHRVDNVPLGLALPAGLISSVGAAMVEAYEAVFHQPDALTYSKTGFLFGANLMGHSTDFNSLHPEATGMLSDYVQNCVIGDIYLNHKYTLEGLMRSEDPYSLIFSRPSPLRGLYDSQGRFQTCQSAASQLQNMMNLDTSSSGESFHYYVTRLFGNRPDATALFEGMMGDSYQYFYRNGQTASDILKHNITINALRKGITGFAARNGDTASLVNLSSESAFAKMRMSQAAMATVGTKTLPTLQTVLFGLLIGLFPVVVLLSLLSVLTLQVLSHYVFALVYLQTWPLLYAVLNNAMNFYLRGQTEGMNVTLSSLSQVQQQYSDIGTTAGWLALSIPPLAFALVKGMSGAMSQMGGQLKAAISSTAGQSASQTVDGTWAFNNMQTDNVTGGKWDTNSSYANGQMSEQQQSGAITTRTAGGETVYNTAPAMSKLPLDINFGKAMNSTAQRLARESETQAESALAGYNHAVNSAYNQAKQFSSQFGKSASTTTGSDQSQSSSQSQAVNQMLSAAHSYAARNHVSDNEAFGKLMDTVSRDEISGRAGVTGSVDTNRSLLGKVAGVAFGASARAELGGQIATSASDSETNNISATGNQGQDHSQDRTSQEARDFRQGLDAVKSMRVSYSASQTDNAANTQLEQLGTTLSVADSQYNQYTTSLNRSHEYSQMASMSESTSAQMQSNYAQEFVGYVERKAPGEAQTILTDTATPETRQQREQLAGEFMDETLRQRVEGNYAAHRGELGSDMQTISPPSQSGDAMAQGQTAMNTRAAQAGLNHNTPQRSDEQIGDVRHRLNEQNESIESSKDGIMGDRSALAQEEAQARSQYQARYEKHAAPVIQENKSTPERISDTFSEFTQDNKE